MPNSVDMIAAKADGNFFLNPMGRLTETTYTTCACTMDEAEQRYASCLYEISLMPGCSLTIANGVKADPNPHPFHFNDSPMVFSVTMSGGACIRFDKPKPQELTVGDKDLYVSFSPDCSGETMSLGTEPHSCVMVLLDPKLLGDLFGKPFVETLPPPLPEIILEGRRTVHVEQSAAPPQTVALADRIMNCSLTPELFRLFAYSAGLEMVCLILDHLRAPRKSGSIPLSREDIAKLHRTRQCLENNFLSPPSLTELSKSVGLNEFKLKRGFKQTFGTTVFGHLQKVRVQAAYTALTTEGKNVSECAWAVGYTNVSHFIAAFKKHFGMTPGEVVKKSRATNCCAMPSKRI